MCGRFVLATSPEEVRRLFRYRETPNFPARHNIAPTQPVAVVRSGVDWPQFTLMRWGLVPPWVKELKGFPALINARSEEAAGKPAFRAAIRRRRCLIPADGFYEWQKTANGKKHPHYITRPDRSTFAFAGLWENWMDAEGNELESAAILTTRANEALAPLHHRLPVVIRPQDHARWLNADSDTVDGIADLLQPVDDDYFTAWPVSTRVNAVANDDAGLIAPLADETTPPEEPKSPAKKADDRQMSLF